MYAVHMMQDWLVMTKLKRLIIMVEIGVVMGGLTDNWLYFVLKKPFIMN